MVDYLDEKGNLTEAGELSFTRSEMLASRLDRLLENPLSEEDFWVVPGLLSTTNTLIYGQSKVGKSYFVSQLVACLVDGSEFLGKKPHRAGGTVLILTTDAGGTFEYQDRLSKIVKGCGNVYVHSLGDAVQWEDVRHKAKAVEADVVVFDHATGLIEGDINTREPWHNLWKELDRFGEGVARVLVGHSTDSRFEGKESKRPMGNAAATQFARAKVFIGAPGDLTGSKRVIQTVANNAPPEILECDFDPEAGFFLRKGARPKQHERSQAKMNAGDKIVDLALRAESGTQEQVLEWIATHEELVEVQGSGLSPDYVRNRIRSLGVLSWNRSKKRYEKKG